MNRDDYRKEKERNQLERMERKLGRIMAAPPARGEMIERLSGLMEHIASIALGLEALETLLIERGLLKDGEVLAKLGELMKQKREQAAASAATEDGPKLIQEC